MSLLDAQVRVWDARRFEYPWPEDSGLPAQRLPHHVDRADGQATRMVFVASGCRPDQALDEARWVNDYRDWAELSGIVASAALADDAGLAGQLDALEAIARVVGVRWVCAADPAGPPRPGALAEGLRALAERDLVFHADPRTTPLPMLVELLAGVDVDVVVADLGGPPVDAGLHSADGRGWQSALRRLAERPNTFLALSGLAAATADADAFGRNADAFLGVAVDAFGPARCMIGSGMPSSLGVRFHDWTDRIRRVTGASGDEWDQLAEDTAATVYGLI